MFQDSWPLIQLVLDYNMRERATDDAVKLLEVNTAASLVTLTISSSEQS